jgi:hypothetical protein
VEAKEENGVSESWISLTWVFLSEWLNECCCGGKIWFHL